MGELRGSRESLSGRERRIRRSVSRSAGLAAALALTLSLPGYAQEGSLPGAVANPATGWLVCPTSPGIAAVVGTPTAQPEVDPTSAPSAEPSAKDSASTPETSIPRDLEEALATLDRTVPPELATAITQGDEADLARFHLDLGRQLRNCWGLWAGSRLARYFNDLGVKHPDDMSAILLTSFRRHLKQEPLRLDEQLAALSPE